MLPSQTTTTEDNEITTKDLMKFMVQFQNKVDVNMTKVEKNFEDTNKKLDDKLNKLNAGMKKLNTEVKTIDKKNEDIHTRMEKRLDDIEEEMKKAKAHRIKTIALKEKEVETRQEDVQPDGRIDWFSRPEGNRKNVEQPIEQDPLRNTTELTNYQSTWAISMEKELSEAANQANLRKQDEQIPEEWTRRISPVRKPLGKLVHRDFRYGLGNDESTDESSSDDDRNWSTVNREKKQEERKKKQKARKISIQTETATKAKNMLGLGPISMDEVRDAMRHSRDLERAKRIAFKDHLAKTL